MKSYYRVMLGQGSSHADECFAGNFIGAGFGIDQDLTHDLPDSWREFNKRFIPIWMAKNPGKSKIAAGLSCGFLWTIAKGMQKGDIVLSPDGKGRYRPGEIVGDYQYVAGAAMPHRRPVQWSNSYIERTALSEPLRSSAGSIGTVSNLSGYRDEIEKLLAGSAPPAIVATDATIEDPAAFAMEKHLEDFLVHNWSQTEFGKHYDLFAEEGEVVGQQYPTDTGPIDLLAVSKDKKELLVLELKRGRASDVVVGQTLRYMGFVLQELAEAGQAVRGAIIALEDDQRLKRALAAVSNVQFYRYQVSFKLFKT